MDDKLIAAITGLLSAAAGSIGTLIYNSRKSKSESKKTDSEIQSNDFLILKEAYREEFLRYEKKFDDLNSKYSKLEAEMEALRDENNDLREKLRLTRAAFPDLPIPMWLKDDKGMMLSLNQAYEDCFLMPQKKTRADYVGHYDEDIWGQAIADVFKRNDLAAVSQKKVSFVIEDTIDNSLLTGWHFFKYPKYIDGIFVGVGGLALPKKDERVISLANEY